MLIIYYEHEATTKSVKIWNDPIIIRLCSMSDQITPSDYSILQCSGMINNISSNFNTGSRCGRQTEEHVHIIVRMMSNPSMTNFTFIIMASMRK